LFLIKLVRVIHISTQDPAMVFASPENQRTLTAAGCNRLLMDSKDTFNRACWQHAAAYFHMVDFL
jgi:hypothetical protein